MPDWLNEVPIGAVLTVAGFIGGIVLALWRFWKAVKPVVDDVRGFLEAWNGRPAEHDASGAEIAPAQPGHAARLIALEADMKAVKHEVQYNHGSSVKDAIRRTETAVNDLRREHQEHVAIAKKSDERLAAVETRLNDKEGTE